MQNWGKHTYNGNWQVVNLPNSYTNTSYAVACSQWTIGDTGGSSTDTIWLQTETKKTVSTFIIGARGSNSAWGCFYITIGY